MGDSSGSGKAAVQPDLAADVKAFVASHQGDCEVTAAGKVRFALTGMEFPRSASADLLERYLAGKALRRACVEKRNQEFDFTAYDKWIVPHRAKGENKFLWCRLTDRTLPKDASVVLGHTQGRRFKAALKKAEAAEAERERIRLKRLEKASKRKAAEAANRKEGATNGAEGSAASEDDSDGGSSAMSDENVVRPGSVPDDGVGEDAEDSAGNSDAPHLEKEDDEDVFWTRGPAGPSKGGNSKKIRVTGAESESDDEDMEDDEWTDLSTALATKLSGGSSESSRGKKPSIQSSGKICADAAKRKPRSGGDSGISASAKRKREKSAVPKKSRRPSVKVRGSVLEGTTT